MREIYTIDDVSIKVDDQTGIFRIEFAYPSPSLIRSLVKTKLIQGATSTSDYKTIQFKATSVKSFAQFQSDLKAATDKATADAAADKVAAEKALASATAALKAATDKAAEDAIKAAVDDYRKKHDTTHLN
jgi:hypothetical protein